MGNIYFTADLHFCHNRPFIYKPRGFKSVEEMNDTILNNILKTVKSNDDLWILGDCYLNDNEYGLELIRQLPGTIHLIWGNHDTTTRQEALTADPRFINEGYATVVIINGYHFYLSHYPTLTGNYDTDKPLKNCLINLHGHTHQNTNFSMINGQIPTMYHVGVDSHNCYPIAAEQIIDDLKETEWKSF